MKFFYSILLIIGVAFSFNAQQDNIKLKGVVVDQNNESIPYAAVGITSISKGTATTEDGTFYLLISQNNVNEILEVSSIGFETYKIKVQEFLNLKEKKIILKEAITSLDEIVISNKKASYYPKMALRKLWKTTLNDKHQLNILYRRFSVEDKKARFLVEHYINVLDKGPLEGKYLGVAIVAGRKSADYRFLKKKLKGHPVNIITRFSPLRGDFRLKDFDWERVGDSSYDGEDILIVEGKNKKNSKGFVRLYIGFDTFGIYKIETSNLNAVYVYKKNKEGKLHLSYHNRTRSGKIRLKPFQKKILNTDKNFITESDKH